ncbi:MAG TPA: hypothetical protein VHJ20_19675 [Polyangia bacterium]|nr:hypothetical protein [Polyangia bacterium]
MSRRLSGSMVLLCAWVGAALAGCGSGGANAGDAASGDAPSEASDAGGLTCAAYCTTIMAACTGSNQQYSGMDDCLNSCKAFPVGTAADTSDDTLGCRATHAGVAAQSAAMALAHCAQAGPGGDGVCGTDCGGYCDIVMTYCTVDNSADIYQTRQDCLDDCATRDPSVKYTAGDPGRTDFGNTVGCVLYHAQMGSSAPEEHCRGDLAPSAGTCRTQ